MATPDPLPPPSAEPPEPVDAADGVDGVDPELATHRHRPWYPGSIGGFLYLGVLATTVIGVWLVATRDWRLGVRWEAGALIAAAACRLVLPKREAGMLAVRHRLIDILILGGCGALLLFLAATIPDQPAG